MVNATPRSGDIGLLDPNLERAYSNLTWLVGALAALEGIGVSVGGSGGNPVLSVLQRLDWDKDAVADTVAHLVKSTAYVDDAADGMHKILLMADSAWDSIVYNTFRVYVSGLEEDCRTLRSTLKEMRSDVTDESSGVFAGLDKITGRVLSFSVSYRQDHDIPANPSQDDLHSPAYQAAVKLAFEDLCSEVRTQVSNIRDLQHLTKKHTAPLHSAYGK